MTRIIATFFGSGLLKPAPGTWGSLAALPALYLLHQIGSFPLVAVATVAVFFVGWWATIRETAGKEDQDPSEIVIDEVAGMWLALWPVSFGASYVGADILSLYPGWIVAFLGFRLFDITKPGPVGWADRKHTPLGVMLDDVIAGLLAAIVVIVFGVIFHVFLM
ncbi:phosphatidylglycerophosphatase A family protein [Actibacterium lipolyticum]|uniref:Phosphatidylglycerophosphatase A n=1 Tax=Actibacterium lipolyticum TaxID=1524263 RepID=A0A238JWV3_9RHOB|nr:phosphatidylglycerophosphatase A [Actibacterium lipolyticum]SMX35138.1 Phosphatidylglycerophosphatase A [Actibacterium lipolyticum]